MPVTITYDLTQVPQDQNNDRTYIRSMLERFNFRRIGGSVFRYEGIEQHGTLHEDWFNHVAPAIMFMRSYILRRNLSLKFFTVDAASVSFLDRSDPEFILGRPPLANVAEILVEPTNQQSAVETIESFLAAATNAMPAPPQH